MAMGPFPVGVATIDLYDDSRPNAAADGRGRWLRTEIWYPAVEASRAAPRESMDLLRETEGVDLGAYRQVVLDAEVPTVEVDAVRDADLDGQAGPFPMLFFSHGSNGIRWQSVFYTIHLASHGYVVLAPDHEHNLIWDLMDDGFDGESVLGSLQDRPQDIRFLLDWALAQAAAPGNLLSGALDPGRIGVTGHSAGAVTAMATPCLDERVGAVVLHSPQVHAGFAFGGCTDLPYPVPSLTMGGTLDRTIAYCSQYCGYRDLLGGPPRYLYELVDGGHFTFADICSLDLVRVAQELQMGDEAENFLRDGCGEANVPYALAHDSINHYATAFFDRHLKGVQASQAHLTDRSEPPFDVVRFFEGEVPDFPGEGGCSRCPLF